MTRLALSFAGSLLLALAVAGCGGDDSSASADEETSAASEGAAPSGASPEEFCAALTSTQVQNGKDVAKLAAEIEATGTPEDIPEEERKGFDSYLEALQSIDEDATKKDLEQMEDLGLSKEQETQVQAFMTYAAAQCQGSGGQGSGSTE